MSFYKDKNQKLLIQHSTAVDDVMETSLRSFFRHLSMPHAYDEFLSPAIKSGSAAIVTATENQSWPPWGLGLVKIHALNVIFPIQDTWASIGNTFCLEEGLSNINLMSAMYSSCLSYLEDDRGVTELRQVVDVDSILSSRILQRIGFSSNGNPYLAEDKSYEVYSASLREHKAALGLEGSNAADLLGGDLGEVAFDRLTSLFYSMTVGTSPFWSAGSTAPDILPNSFAGSQASGGAPRRHH